MIEKETALKFLAAGLAVLPADKTLKRPVMAWKNYQEHRPATADVERWFSDRHNAICLICGKVSGNLEVIDFDQHGELYPAWEAQIPAELKSKLVIERTQSSGFHVAYRCAEVVGGNTELAQVSRRATPVPIPAKLGTKRRFRAFLVFVRNMQATFVFTV